MKRMASIKIISYLWLGSILGSGFAFLTQAVLARELGVSNFGKFSAALGIINLATPLAGFGVSSFWLQAFGKEGWGAVRWLKSSILLITSTTSATLIIVLAWAYIGPNDKATQNILFILCCFLAGQAMLELFCTRLQLEERYISIAIWQVAPQLLRLILILITFLLFGKESTPELAAYIYTASSIAILTYGALSLIKMANGDLKLKGHGKKPNQSSNQRQPRPLDLVVLSWPFGASTYFHIIYFQSNIIILNYIAGSESAGLYNSAFLILSAIYILPNTIYQKFLLPKLHRWSAHQPELLYRVYKTGNLLMLATGTIAATALITLSSSIIPLIFGDSFQPAILPLKVLALAIPIRFVATSIGAMLTSSQSIKKKIKLMLVTAVFSLTFNTILIPKFGLLGAAITSLASEVLLLVLFTYAVKKIVFSKNHQQNK
ncbi:oligosaccharide flippase family protein [Pseudomonas sp. NY15435]|uniref:oligosaccharide flippase family protein n=1 Tax=Pseudomonas sp. NY15435 TaxID=3400358 RepID=UPI003A895BDE